MNRSPPPSPDAAFRTKRKTVRTIAQHVDGADALKWGVSLSGQKRNKGVAKCDTTPPS